MHKSFLISKWFKSLMKTLTFNELRLSATAQHHYLTLICQWEEQAYGKGLHRQPDELARCVGKNGAGFIVLLQEDELLAYADVWQLTTDFYERLRVGVIDEESIEARDILSCTDDCTGLWYVGSMIVNPRLEAEPTDTCSIGVCQFVQRIAWHFQTAQPVSSACAWGRIVSFWQQAHEKMGLWASAGRRTRH
ncbi:hypothetical protein B9Z51_12175 [Limnohabitans sp. T6-5]|uniref:hypothetical protein n=1 Tax=Limnohabitans sp. T6-5 TaxID=1100724 RepID=UPI000D393E87|nr:hypothetical protein [Limnohabitans sp. T6-5]PUE06702.1 hypothetical protein B9Z51_12175 [Limnohabitans sp. T6-5]